MLQRLQYCNYSNFEHALRWRFFPVQSVKLFWFLVFFYYGEYLTGNWIVKNETFCTENLYPRPEKPRTVNF